MLPGTCADYDLEADIYHQKLDAGEDSRAEGSESLAWYQESRRALLLEEPGDEEVRANFKYTVHQGQGVPWLLPGLEPAKSPSSSKEFGKDRAWGKGWPEHTDKVCMRCGKKGHNARNGLQSPSYGAKSGGKGSGTHFVKVVFAESPASSQEKFEEHCINEGGPGSGTTPAALSNRLQGQKWLWARSQTSCGYTWRRRWESRHAQCSVDDLIMLAMEDCETFQVLVDAKELGEETDHQSQEPP